MNFITSTVVGVLTSMVLIGSVLSAAFALFLLFAFAAIREDLRDLRKEIHGVTEKIEAVDLLDTKGDAK